MPEPWPAPAWIRTRWPERCNSSTPTGVRATRDSCVLISLGTPTTYLSPFGIADHPFSGSLNQPAATGRRFSASFWERQAGESRATLPRGAPLDVGERRDTLSLTLLSVFSGSCSLHALCGAASPPKEWRR